ncbi:hypothetical protein RRG08_062651 [Elysia crispata]|uniref:Uncharacterized protein n=1 Tax=Elysia crispata TaxID=231223 RepID=A0AAE0YYF3_9GAST|nr:hypothetical protein RRG08_062651 [Elysia crispata]
METFAPLGSCGFDLMVCGSDFPVSERNALETFRNRTLDHQSAGTRLWSSSPLTASNSAFWSLLAGRCTSEERSNKRDGVDCGEVGRM